MGRRVLAALALLAVAAGPAAAHHVGTYVPRDNEISANFKQIKFSIQAQRFEVALALFDGGPLRTEMQAQAARLPEGLEAATRAALAAADGPRAEQGLMVFFAALARDLAREAGRRVAKANEPAHARMAAARKFLEAIWRYYNLVDFAVGQHDPKAAVAFRLAFDEAEAIAKPPAVVPPEAGRPPPPPPGPPPAPERLREPLARMARILSGLIETSTLAVR